MSLPSDAKSLVSRLLTDLNTPRSLSVKLLMDHGEWAQLAKLELQPSCHYLDTVSHAAKFARDFQATEILRKCSDLVIKGIDRKAEARRSFLESEKVNAQTNARLDPWFQGYPSNLEPHQAGRIWNVIQKARKEIRRVLGPVPPELPQWRFGPGTAIGFEGGRYPTLADKLASQITMTPSVRDIFFHGIPWAWERALWERNAPPVEYVRSERFSTVSKNALTDRTIGIQAMGNLCVQLAIGRHFRARLLYSHARIDLNFGQDLHKELACKASISNEDATIDVKNASNSVSRNAVRLLFPEDWVELLEASRMTHSLFKREELRLEMFSAMGNGFTFELETLLFWALARAIGVERPHVYGDDIIIPVGHVDDYMAVIRYFGFTANLGKTFSSGPFRESCGGNFFLGFEVKPFRIEEFPRDPAAWISAHNGLWRSSRSIMGQRATHRARMAALRNLPSDIRRCGGPEVLGDLVLHGLPGQTVVRNCVRFFRVWRPIQHKWAFKRYGGEALQSAMALIGIPSAGIGYRNNVTGFRFGYLPWS